MRWAKKKTKEKRQIQIYGDSHVSSLSIACNQLRAADPKAMEPIKFVKMLGAATDFYKPFFEERDGKVYFTNENAISLGQPVCTKSGEIIKDTGIQSVISLGFHTQTLLTSVMWQTHSLWNTQSDDKKRQILSMDAFKEITLFHNRYICEFLAAMKNCGHEFIVLEAPPPTSRFALFELGYSKEHVLKLNAQARQVMHEYLDTLGIPVISTPDKVTKDGFLLDKYLIEDERDRHHGNAEYSKFVIKNILKMT